MIINEEEGGMPLPKAFPEADLGRDANNDLQGTELRPLGARTGHRLSLRLLGWHFRRSGSGPAIHGPRRSHRVSVRRASERVPSDQNRPKTCAYHLMLSGFNRFQSGFNRFESGFNRF